MNNKHKAFCISFDDSNGEATSLYREEDLAKKAYKEPLLQYCICK